ncbi:FCD domain-containing protein [Sphingobium baderi]|nr:FCD domain-containing protein [Sphingobium baderi]
MAAQARGGTLVARVVRELSALSLQCEEGAYLGAEDDLIAKLGVSRPTLKQAAKIAESERMISVRRGIRGGFYAARPNVNDSIRAINRYLRLRGVTLRELAVTGAISEEAAGFAAQCDDAGLRTQLKAMLVEARECIAPRALLDFDTRFVGHLAVMSGNPVIEVIVAMSYSFGRDEQGIYLYANEEQQAVAREHFDAIGQAVLKRDSELARFMMRRRLAVIGEWIGGADASQFGPINQLEI